VFARPSDCDYQALTTPGRSYLMSALAALSAWILTALSGSLCFPRGPLSSGAAGAIPDYLRFPLRLCRWVKLPGAICPRASVAPASVVVPWLRARPAAGPSRRPA